METGAVVGEGGEVGLGRAAADSVVRCSPGWGEPGSVRGLEIRGGGKGDDGGERYFVEPKST